MSTRQRNGHSKEDSEDSDEDSVSQPESSYDTERAQPKLKQVIFNYFKRENRERKLIQ